MTSVNRLVNGPVTAVRLLLPGAGVPHPRVRLDGGVVAAAGVEWADEGATLPRRRRYPYWIPTGRRRRGPGTSWSSSRRPGPVGRPRPRPPENPANPDEVPAAEESSPPAPPLPPAPVPTPEVATPPATPPVSRWDDEEERIGRSGVWSTYGPIGPAAVGRAIHNPRDRGVPVAGAGRSGASAVRSLLSPAPSDVLGWSRLSSNLFPAQPVLAEPVSAEPVSAETGRGRGGVERVRTPAEPVWGEPARPEPCAAGSSWAESASAAPAGASRLG